MTDELNKTRAYALRILGFRAHSVAEIRQKLSQRKLPDSAIRQVVEELRNQGYLNDRRFAQELVRGLVRRKAVGRYYILSKLRDHLIDSTIANEILSREFTVEKETELAREAAARKAEEFEVKLSKLSRVQKGRIIRFLNSRGFDNDVIRETVENMAK
jgi:regulatory protein